MFLLRRFAETGRDDIRDRLEPALAEAIEACRDAAALDQARWLSLFAAVAAASEDGRLAAVVDDLKRAVSASWGHGASIETAAAGVEACLAASDDGDAMVQAAIDELERVVSVAYRPGEGVAPDRHASGRQTAALVDQIAAASALVAAFERTGRLPYSMLAEELTQFARRTLWDRQQGGFFETPGVSKPFSANCDAVCLCCRLAGLHASDDYRRAAVLAGDADYRRDATLTLEWLSGEAPRQGIESARYGLALDQWLRL
jgi:uncharacterized protein YyaL (SSP411 family)